jgi:hypothetical protein
MHQSWCFKNDITIWLEPTDWKGGKIIVNYKGERFVGEETYVLYKMKPKDTRWWNVIWKLYTKYYEENSRK